MKFCGKYCGKYNRTEVTSAGTTTSKGTAVLTISEVGCGAYLINIVKDGDSSTSINDLAYLENNILRSESSSAKGITSTYFDDGKLIHQVSGKPNDSKWVVSNFSLKKYKC